MVFTLSINIIILFLSFLARFKKTRFFLLGAFIVLFLFLALRFNYGSDYLAYFSYYTQVESGLSYDEIGKEYGWYLLNYITRDITFFGLVAITSLIYVIAFYMIVKQTVSPKYYWIAMFVLVFDPDNMLIHLSAMRQSLAICMIIFGILSLLREKKIISFIFFILAISFHISSFIFVLTFFLIRLTQKIKLNQTKSIIIFTLSVFLFPISSILISIFPIPDMYSTYLEESGSSVGLGFLINSIVFWIYLSRDKTVGNGYIVYFRSAEVGYFLTPVRYAIPMFGRIIFYFSVFNVVAFPMLIQSFKKKELRFIILFLVISFTIFRFYLFFQSNITGESYEEYLTFFEYLS